MANLRLSVILLLAGAIMFLWDGGQLLDVMALFSSDSSPSSITLNAIAFDLRLPRILTGMLVGMALASCGVLMQATFHNPLASPFTLGTSAGAALGAMIALATWQSGGLTLPVGMFAFLGALLISLPTLFIASRRLIPLEAVLLTGVALSYAAVAMGSAMNFLNADSTIFSYIRWSLGSLTITQWSDVALVVVAAILPVATCWVLRNKLDAMLTGEEWALARGINTGRIRAVSILVVAASVGMTVAVCGPIGFIGLMCPHMARGVSGATVSRIAITAPLIGALVLVSCDWFGRNIPFFDSAPQVPPGVMTAALGTPAFVWLLFRRFGRNRLR